MKCLKALLIFSILIVNICTGQSTANKITSTSPKNEFPIKPLNVGDYLPDVELSNLINYKSKKARLSDFKGKFIILDFWNKHCSGCIELFPKMEKLQEKFGDKIQVLLVTADNLEDIKELSKKSKNVRDVKLPIVLTEKFLHTYFPNVIGLPWYAIIDKTNRVVATTNFLGMTEENIQTLLDGKPLNKNYIIEQLLDFDWHTPLIVEGKGRHWNRLQYFSMIMKSMEQTVNKGFGQRLEHPITKEEIKGGISLFEVPMIFLYTHAYGDGYVIVEDDNPEQYFMPEGDGLRFNYFFNKDFKAKQCFTYEQIVPKGKEHLAKLFMQSDLEKYFGFTGMREIKKMKCYILYRLDSIDRVSTKYTEKNFLKSYYPLDVRDSVDQFMRYRYKQMSSIINRMYGEAAWVKKRTYNAPILLNETGFDDYKYVDMHFTADISNLELLKQEISKFGLGIKIEERPVNCLVLKKNQFWAKPTAAKK